VDIFHVAIEVMFSYEGFTAGRTLKRSGSVFVRVDAHVFFKIRNSVLITTYVALRFLAMDVIHMTLEMIVPWKLL
jgi:hypothetical protein